MERLGVLEYWSNGALGSDALLHHSNTPLLHFAIFSVASSPPTLSRSNSPPACSSPPSPRACPHRPPFLSNYLPPHPVESVRPSHVPSFARRQHPAFPCRPHR